MVCSLDEYNEHYFTAWVMITFGALNLVFMTPCIFIDTDTMQLLLIVFLIDLLYKNLI